MEQEEFKCSYCCLSYSELRFPYRLRCRCVICEMCLKIFKKVSTTTCCLCNKSTNLTDAIRFKAFYSAIVEENLKYQQTQKQKAENNSSLIKKVQSCSFYLISCQKLLTNLKMVQNIYNSCRFVPNYEEIGQLSTNNLKIEYLKKHDLLNINSSDRRTSKSFIRKHLQEFLTISNEIVYMHESFLVPNPSKAVWLGKSLVCQEFIGPSFVYVKNVSGFDLIVQGVGLFLGIKGDSVVGEGLLKIIEYEAEGKSLMVDKRFDVGLENTNRYLVEVGNFEYLMKGGLRYSFEYEITDQERILVKYNSFTKFKSYNFEVSSGENIGGLAYLRCKKIKTKELKVLL